MTSIDHVRVHTVKRQAHLKYKYLLIRLIYTKLEIDFQTSFIFFFQNQMWQDDIFHFHLEKKIMRLSLFPQFIYF